MLTEFEKQTGTSVLVYADGRKKPDEYELELITGRSMGNGLLSPTGSNGS